MNSSQRGAQIGRVLERRLSFSSRLNKVEDIPFVFRKTVARLLEGREHKIRHILFTPEFGSFGAYCPATLFLVTDDEWLAMSADRSGAPSVRYADFAQTRLVEFSLELLDGSLVLESGEAGEDPCVLRFNLASRDLFQDALADMLGSGERGVRDDPSVLPGFASLSMGMRSSVSEAVMPGDKCLALAAWSRADLSHTPDRLAVRPGGILLTERYLCVFTVDDHVDRSVSGDLSVFGRGVIYLSRRQPIMASWTSHEQLDELTLSTGEGAELSSLQVLLPHRVKADIEGVLARLGGNG